MDRFSNSKINGFSNFNINTQNTDYKVGKRINTNDLVTFIKKNLSTINSIGCIDLNDNTSSHLEEINKISDLKFQDIQKINFLPRNLSRIFENNNHKYLHIGVLKQFSDRDTRNISVFSAILSSLRQVFSKQTISNQSHILSTLMDRLQKEIMGSKFKYFGYNKFKWEQEFIKESIDKCNSNKQVLRYISDYFHINIFVLDIENDELIFCSDKYVPYKKHIFLLKFKENNFEPFVMEHSKCFTNDDIPVKCVLKNHSKIKVFTTDPKQNYYIDFETHIEDLDKYIVKGIVKLKEKKLTYKEKIEAQQKDTLKLQLEIEKQPQQLQPQPQPQQKKKSSSYSTPSEDDSNSDTLSNSNSENLDDSDSDTKSKKQNKNKYTEKELNKMKLAELQQVAKSFDIMITEKVNGKSKPKNKKKLIQDILSQV